MAHGVGEVEGQLVSVAPHGGPQPVQLEGRGALVVAGAALAESVSGDAVTDCSLIRINFAAASEVLSH